WQLCRGQGDPSWLKKTRDPQSHMKKKTEAPQWRHRDGQTRELHQSPWIGTSKAISSSSELGPQCSKGTPVGIARNQARRRNDRDMLKRKSRTLGADCLFAMEIGM